MFQLSGFYSKHPASPRRESNSSSCLAHQSRQGNDGRAYLWWLPIIGTTAHIHEFDAQKVGTPPNHRQKENHHGGSYIHVPIFGVDVVLSAWGDSTAIGYRPSSRGLLNWI